MSTTDAGFKKRGGRGSGGANPRYSTDERFNVIWDRLDFYGRDFESLTTVVVTQDTFKEALKGSSLLSCWENDGLKKKKKAHKGAGAELPPSLLPPHHRAEKKHSAGRTLLGN